jgi:transcriptional regulator with XRE-family HTH domain
MSRPPTTLGDRLKLARTKRGYTQGALADKVGLKQADISKLQNGLMLKTTAMARLVTTLRVPAQWLEFGEGPEPDWSSSTEGGEAADPEPRFLISEADAELLDALKVLKTERELEDMKLQAKALLARAQEAITRPVREQYMGAPQRRKAARQ